MEVTIYIVILIVGIVIGIVVSKILFGKVNKTSKVIEDKAYKDPLTGAKNRHLFMHDLDELIKKGNKFAICFMDLDGFKQINDTMGHDAGDELLIGLSNTFRSKLPKNVSSYRIGGDEFGLIIQNIKTTEDITVILDNLRKELNVPFVIDNNNISLEYSLGVSVYPEDSKVKNDLVTYADDAMYFIKEHGKNDYYFHNKVLKAKLENRTRMEKELKEAFSKKQFGINYQPRISLKNRNEISLEALLYWNHPVLGKISSEYFIKQAEEISLIIKLDEFVLELACQQLQDLKKMFQDKSISISLNMSNSHVKRKNFAKNICDILRKYNISNGEIEIEFTDDVDIRKIDEYKYLFDSIKNAGANIIINNLQIKHEPITLIKSLPIDKIKLVSNYIAKDSCIGNKVLQDIITISKDLDYTVIVVAIDKADELIYSIKNGADYLQGNLIFEMLDYEELCAFIEDYDNKVKVLEKNFHELAK